MPIQALSDISQLQQPFFVDWFNNVLPGGNVRLASGNPVGEEVDYYKVTAGGQALTGITAHGAGAGAGLCVRRCSTNDLNAGFWDNEGLLVASGSGAPPGPGHALITLTFSVPVRAIGAFVSGAKGNLRAPYSAVLWIRVDGAVDWEPPVSAAGMLGDPVAASGSPRQPLPRAAFLGAVATGAAKIAAAGFDVSLIGNQSLDLAAVSGLYFTR